MTDTQTTTELDFSKIGMTEGQLKKLSERPRLPDGTVSRFIITNPQGRVLRNGASVLDFQAIPLQDPTDANSGDSRRAVYHKVELPTVDMSAEVLDKVMGRARGFLQAVGIEVDEYYCHRAAARLAQDILFPLPVDEIAEGERHDVLE